MAVTYSENWDHLHKLRLEDDEREAQETKKAQGAAQLLLGRLRNRIVGIKFKAPGGDFEVLIRLPSPRLRRRIYKLEAEILTASEERLTEINVEFAHILEKLCIDKSLTAEYWVRGEGYDIEVPTRIFNVAKGLELPDREDIEFFRPDTPGPKPE